MKKMRIGLTVIEVLIVIIGILLLLLSKSFYEVLISYAQNEKGSLIELLRNSTGVILSLILSLMFIWTMVTILIKGEKNYLDKKEKKTLIGAFLKINGIPILMIIFSIIFFEKCFVLSTIFLFIIAIYSSAAVIASMVFSGVILKFLLEEIKEG